MVVVAMRDDVDPTDELVVTFRDGEPTTIRTNLRLVGSDAMFTVEDGTATLAAQVRSVDVDAVAAEVAKLPFIDAVETGAPETGGDRTDG